jgi:hypothetical protein
MGDQRGDERVPHAEAAEAFDREDAEDLTVLLPEVELRARLERGWSAAQGAYGGGEWVVSYRRAFCTGGWT